MTTGAVEPLPILYFDANALHYYRSRRPDVIGDLDVLFQHGLSGAIQCVTSSFTRLEMLNFSKRAAFAVQELEAGRIDLQKILEDARTRPRVQPSRLADTREAIDSWFEEQARVGRLRIAASPDPVAVERLSEVLMEQTSIAGMGDCTHVATAILLGCSILVAEDEHLRWCVEHELLAAGEPRRRVREALATLTGADELSMQALTIHNAHVTVERLLARARQDRQDATPAEEEES